jgi:hypothetical protein
LASRTCGFMTSNIPKNEETHAECRQDALPVAITPRVFLKTCLAENDRRLSVYDCRLLRPKIVPGLVRLAVSLWPTP